MHELTFLILRHVLLVGGHQLGGHVALAGLANELERFALQHHPLNQTLLLPPPHKLVEIFHDVSGVVQPHMHLIIMLLKFLMVECVWMGSLV